jgi:hypothetical protein
MQAEFDQLPFPGARFDAVIYNASLHYSADYLRTLGESSARSAPRWANRGSGFAGV